MEILDLYNLAISNQDLPIRYAATRKMQIKRQYERMQTMRKESNKKKKPPQYRTPQHLYHVNSNAPDKLLATLDIELDEDQLTYLKAHMSEPRTKLAKKLGISKLQVTWKMEQLKRES